MLATPQSKNRALLRQNVVEFGHQRGLPTRKEATVFGERSNLEMLILQVSVLVSTKIIISCEDYSE